MAKRNYEDYSSTWLYPDYKRPKQLNPFEAFKENNSTTITNSCIRQPSQISNISLEFRPRNQQQQQQDPDLKSVDLSALDAYQELLNNLNKNKKNNNDIPAKNQHSFTDYFTTPVTSREPHSFARQSILEGLTPPSGVYTFNAQRPFLHPPTPSQLTNNLLFSGQLHPSIRASMPTKLLRSGATTIDFSKPSTPFWKKLTNLRKFVKNLPSSVNNGKKLLHSGMNSSSRDSTNSHLTITTAIERQDEHEIVDLEKEPEPVEQLEKDDKDEKNVDEKKEYNNILNNRSSSSFLVKSNSFHYGEAKAGHEDECTPLRVNFTTYPYTKSPSLSSTISLSSTKSLANSSFASSSRTLSNNRRQFSFRYPLLSTSTPTETTVKSWREQKYLDESENYSAQIRELEQEAHERSMARHNRQVYSEEYRRLRLQMEGLILERPEPKKDDFPALSDEAEALIDQIWNPRAKPTEIFAKGNGAEISRKDLLTLCGLDWLNDEVINFYMWMICQRSIQNSDLPKTYAFATFFYPNLAEKGYNSVRRWTKKVDIFSYDILIVPVHLTAHWCLAIIDIKNQCIQYYDSLLGTNSYCLTALQNYLEQEHMDKKKIQKSFSDFKIQCRKDIPRQLNGSDCGMFTCKFAEYASRRAPINFDQTHMPYFRRRMVWEICQQQLL